VLSMSAQPEDARRMAANGRKLALELFDEASNIRKLRDMFAARYASFVEPAPGNFDKPGGLQ